MALPSFAETKTLTLTWIEYVDVCDKQTIRDSCYVKQIKNTTLRNSAEHPLRFCTNHKDWVNACYEISKDKIKSEIHSLELEEAQKTTHSLIPKAILLTKGVAIFSAVAAGVAAIIGYKTEPNYAEDVLYTLSLHEKADIFLTNSLAFSMVAIAATAVSSLPYFVIKDYESRKNEKRINRIKELERILAFIDGEEKELTLNSPNSCLFDLKKISSRTTVNTVTPASYISPEAKTITLQVTEYFASFDKYSVNPIKKSTKTIRLTNSPEKPTLFCSMHDDCFEFSTNKIEAEVAALKSNEKHGKKLDILQQILSFIKGEGEELTLDVESSFYKSLRQFRCVCSALR